MEIPILRGHAFSGEELHTGGLAPALISTAMAQRFWPAENPVGKEFLAGQNRRYQVIGIVPNVNTLHLGQEDGPLFYGLIADTGAAADAKMFLRVNRDASSAVSAIPALVRQIDPNVLSITHNSGWEVSSCCGDRFGLKPATYRMKREWAKLRYAKAAEVAPQRMD
jgi:hypothetical protein